MKADIVFTDRI